MTTREMIEYSREVLDFIEKSDSKSTVKAFIACNKKTASRLMDVMFSVGIPPESIIIETSDYIDVDKVICSHNPISI